MFIGIPPVISNFFGTIGGAITGVLGKAGTVVSNFATKIAPNLTKGLGKAFNAIKTAGQGAYNSVTEAMGNGMDRAGNFLKGEGFTLSEGRTSIFNRPPSTPNVTPTKAALDPNLNVEVSIEGDVLKPSGESFLETDFKPTAPELNPETFELTKGTAVDTAGGSVDNALLAPEKTLGEKTKDYFSSQLDDFTETLKNPGQALGESVKQGALGGISQSIAMDVAGPPPTQKVMHSRLSDFMTPTTQRQLDAATWNSINTSYQKAGSSFGAAGDAMTPYFTELANFDNDINYQRQMAMLNPTFNPIR